MQRGPRDDSLRPRFILTAALCAICTLPAAAADLVLEECRISGGAGFPGIAARRGILDRPEDPSDRNSPLLYLRVAVVPALSLEPEPDAFVPIAGGPGQSSIEFYSLLSHAFEQIRRTAYCWINAGRVAQHAWTVISAMKSWRVN